MTRKELARMPKDFQVEYLLELVCILDRCDRDDAISTEGWRNYLNEEEIVAVAFDNLKTVGN